MLDILYEIKTDPINKLSLAEGLIENGYTIRQVIRQVDCPALEYHFFIQIIEEPKLNVKYKDEVTD